MTFKRCDLCNCELTSADNGGEWHRFTPRKALVGVKAVVHFDGSHNPLDICDSCLFDVVEAWAVSARKSRLGRRDI